VASIVPDSGSDEATESLVGSPKRMANCRAFVSKRNFARAASIARLANRRVRKRAESRRNARTMGRSFDEQC